MKACDKKPINNPARVLVVDGNLDDSDLLLRQLQKSSFEGCVKVIADGGQFWNFLITDKSRSDLVVIFLELDLPSLSGVKLVRRMKSRPELCDIPIIVMTSANEHKDLDECARHGVSEYIIKPVTYLGFSKALANLFQSQMARTYLRMDRANTVYG